MTAPTSAAAGHDLVEERQDGLFVGIGHVDARESQRADAFEHRAQPGGVGAGDFNQVIVATKPQSLRGRFMHRRRRRMGDRRADQAEQEALGIGEAIKGSGFEAMGSGRSRGTSDG